ncbi:MAG: sugar transferase [Candidatus Bipolaricaulis sp.]|nr:sugar transferase [Candidatus Bipolaricaulis sp.]
MHEHGSAMLKRAMDLGTSALGLIVLALPFAAIALAVKLDDGGPIFFRQVRVGRGGRPFRVWKFRTMSVMQIDPKGPDRMARDDQRITRVGRFLRNLGLDELPQLLNVLVGEMSLVGPRPTLAYQVAQYDDFQRRRLEVRPGITSFAVVSGRNALSWVERIRLDVWYVDHGSFCLDLRILALTLWKVLITREGLYGIDGANDTFVSLVDSEQRREDERD